MTYSTNKRIEWPDVARGICIISVIIGHAGIANINKIVYMYHLPMYFLLGGYFLKRKPDIEFVCKKVKRLLYPYYVTCAAICLIGCIHAKVIGQSAKNELVSWIKASIYAAGDNWTEPIAVRGIGAIWFLWAMFWALIIVNHLIEAKYGKVIVACIAFFGWSSFDKTNIWLPLDVQAGMLASLYVMIGYEIREHRLFHELGSISLISILLISLWSIWNNNGFYLVHNYMGNGWMDFLTSICCSITIAYLSEFICKHFTKIKCILAWLGRNSLIILCFHATDAVVFIQNRETYFKLISMLVYAIGMTVLFNICRKMLKIYQFVE